jgi:hypothetical protein
MEEVYTKARPDRINFNRGWENINDGKGLQILMTTLLSEVLL